ncbi:MAG: TspO/MBR family protein [Gaiellaceae bacterium]
MCVRSATQRRLPFRPGEQQRRSAAQSPPGTRVYASRAGLRPRKRSGPVWTVLYAQMASSAQRVAGSSDPGRRRALTLWWLKLGLNAAWTPVFFGARRTAAAAVVVCACPARARSRPPRPRARVDRRAGLLYAPYLAWSTYAALNLEIWRRNRSYTKSQ